MLSYRSYVLWAPPKGHWWTRKCNFTSCYNRELRDSVLCLLHRQSIILTCHNVTEGNIERNKNWPVRMGDLFSPLPESNYEKTAWVIFSWKKLKLSFQLWPYFFAVCDNIVCCYYTGLLTGQLSNSWVRTFLYTDLTLSRSILWRH